MLLPATTTTATTTTTSSVQQRHQSTFQTPSSSLVDDGGGAAGIPSHYDHYNYIELDQLEVNHPAADEGAAEQRQTGRTDNYQALDPSVLARLRQPPAPSVYDRLIPDVPYMNQGMYNTEPGNANPDNSEGVDPASLFPREDDGINSTSQSTRSAVHDDDTVVPSQTSHNYQRLDPSVPETPRQPLTPSVYASLSPNNNAEPSGANPHNSEAFDLTSLLPREGAGICNRPTSQNIGSGAHDYIADPQDDNH